MELKKVDTLEEAREVARQIDIELGDALSQLRKAFGQATGGWQSRARRFVQLIELAHLTVQQLT